MDDAGMGGETPLGSLLSSSMHSCLSMPSQIVNLALAADATHRWYKATFRTYPKNRKALIPGVW